MTSYEHAMLGVTQVLSTGLHRRYGWQLVAMAGAVALSPDWDGLTLVGGVRWFDLAHRAWGHNLFVCAGVGGLLAAADYRWELAGRAGRVVQHALRDAAASSPPRGRNGRSPGGYAVWIAVGVLVALTHLAADLVVSGTASLSDWQLQLLWPFSRQGFVFPLVPWGDPVISILFVAGMFALWRWPSHLQRTALLTLASITLYLGCRGAMR